MKNNKKVLILGSTGMLGHQVYFKLKDEKEIDLYDLSFRNKLHDDTIICDVTNLEKLSKIIQDIQPDILINCIGVLIKGSNTNPKNSIFINAFIPHWLASELEKFGGKLIHVSTDCVFSGKKGDYVESDFGDADDVYGRGKALGEVISSPHVTLRTSIIGPELKNNGEGLFHWFMTQDQKIQGYTKAFWGGVTTLELANFISYSIEKEFSGLYHVTNNEKINKFELLKLFKSIFNKQTEIEAVEGKAVDKSLINTNNELNYSVPSFIEMLTNIHRFMDENKSLYSGVYFNEKK